MLRSKLNFFNEFQIFTVNILLYRAHAPKGFCSPETTMKELEGFLFSAGPCLSCTKFTCVTKLQGGSLC